MKNWSVTGKNKKGEVMTAIIQAKTRESAILKFKQFYGGKVVYKVEALR